MAGKLRYWKEKDGRFYARIAVPKPLIPFIGKSELIEPLGGDRRAAIRKHPAAVARLQAQIVHAEQRAAQSGIGNIEAGRFSLPPDQIAASHYAQRLTFDDELRNNARYTQIGVDDGLAQRLRDAMAGRLSDAELFDLIGPRIERFRASGNLTAAPMTDEWRQIARALCVAEYEALSRVAERDEGDFTGKPTHPLLVNAKPPEEALPPVPLKTLFSDYIAIRQALGKHQDGAPGWQNALLHLIKFVGHSDARRVTKRNLLDWRDALLTEKKSPKTISDVYLASVRAVLRWAFENDRLPTNEAETVRQEVPKKVQLRERGYTTPEALKVLEASFNYCPPVTNNPANRESLPVTAAKRWVPLLCAFSGARVTEITQLRKEDVRQEGDRWVIRITPDAGSVKTGSYRDVPLHRQVVALGFISFVKAAKAGPLFHNKPKPEEYLAGARATSGRLSGWLQEAGLVPANIQPSYGWRHRFKTQGRELGMSDRIIDAIQGHAGKTASDGYGDVTLIARMRMIDALPDYELSGALNVQAHC
jgi:integrase